MSTREHLVTAPDNDYVTWGAFEWIVGGLSAAYTMALLWIAGKIMQVLGKDGIDDERIKQLVARGDERHLQNKEEFEKLNANIVKLSDNIQQLVRENHYRRT